MYIKQKNTDVIVNLENYEGAIESHPALSSPSKEDCAFELVNKLPENYATLNFKQPTEA